MGTTESKPAAPRLSAKFYNDLESKRFNADRPRRRTVLKFVAGFAILLFLCIRLSTHYDKQFSVRLHDAHPGKPKLTFKDSFKIVVFSDLHFGERQETDWGPEQDVKSTKLMNEILDAEKPNFVAFLGDMVTGQSKLLIINYLCEFL